MALFCINPLGYRALDSNGDPVSGALMNVYQQGSETAVSLFTSEAGSSSLSNPVVADSTGTFVPVWVGGRSIKIDITDSDGASLDGFPIDVIGFPIGHGNLPNGSTRPSHVQEYGFWVNDSVTDTHTINYFTGSSSVPFMTFDTSENEFSFPGGLAQATLESKGATARLRLNETDGTATHAITDIIRGGDITRIRTLTDAAADAGDVMIIRNSASGASSIEFLISDTEAARVEAAGTSMSDAQAIVTKEKGDAAYQAISSMRFKEALEIVTGLPQEFWEKPVYKGVYGGDLPEDHPLRGKPTIGPLLEDLVEELPAIAQLDDKGLPHNYNAAVAFGVFYAKIQHLEAQIRELSQ